jgi:hypothetical protein
MAYGQPQRLARLDEEVAFAESTRKRFVDPTDT